MSYGRVVAIIGIDTDVGKTVAVGLLGRFLLTQGYSVITQKIAQTGCTGISQDIIRHRELMGIGLQDVDLYGLTCPYVFPKPCSPHLAASLTGKRIDCKVITDATLELVKNYDYVLLEGVGGLLVPLNEDVTTFDYLQKQCYPLILVSCPRLGSINHTLAALELAACRGVEVRGILYNRYDASDNLIAEDSANVFLTALRRYGHSNVLVNMIGIESYQDRDILGFEDFFLD